MRFLLLLCLVCCTVLRSPALDIYETALLKYEAADYQGAVRDFKTCLEGGGITPQLAHNIANAEYRAGNEGQAILWYRRALALDPGQAESAQNLRFMEGRVGFLSFDATGGTWWGFRIIGKRSSIRTWLFISAWALALSIVWLGWMTPRPGRRWPLVVAVSLAAFSCLLAVIWLVSRTSDPAPLVKRYVVTATEVSATTAPAEAATTVVSLPPGSEVLPEGQPQGNWTYVTVATPDSGEGKPLRGWVRSDRIEPLWPYSASLVE